MRCAGVLLLGAILTLAGCALCGEKDGNRQRKPLGPQPGEDQEARAGYPKTVSPCAQPSDTGHYTGYLVGGGAPVCGGPPGPDEGTWGWDYCGLCLPVRIALDWWHGKYQGGGGNYATEGPAPLKKFEERHE
jgi:hypothetical protein